MMYGDGALLNLLQGWPTWGTSWENPVPITSHLGQLSLGSIQTGRTCYLDRLDTSPSKEIEYLYQRYTLNGDRGVIFYPKTFFDVVNCVTAGPRDVDLFIGCRATAGTLHAIPEHLDQGTVPCSNAAGPKLPNFAIPIFLQSIPYREGADRWAIVAMGNGGSGNHPVWQMMQHNITLLKDIRDRLALDEDYCFDVKNTFIAGASFGASIALLQSMLDPQEFDGCLAVGAAGVGPEGFYGTERLQRAGQFLSNYGSEAQVPGSNVWIEDAWYLHEVQELIEYQISTGNQSDALANASVLKRLQARAAAQTALFYRPFVLIGADEDLVTLANVFRHQFDDVLENTNIPNTSIPYSDYGIVLPYAFQEHSGASGEGLALLLHPGTYFPNNATIPSGGNVVDWLKARHDNWKSQGSPVWQDPPPAIAIDENVAPLNSISDYVFHEATISSPPATPSGALSLTRLWTEAPPNGNGRGFLGTGIEPGINHNLIVEDIDDDGNLEVVYGESAGFVHILEWDETNDALVFEWRSPDMGTAITGLDSGTFAKPGGGTMTGLVAMSHSGEIWGIWYDSTASVFDARQLTGPMVYGGERENPDLAIGAHVSGATSVFIVGTGIAHATSGKPNACRLQRLDVTDITTGTISVGTAEDFEPVTELVYDDATGELLAGTARGYFAPIVESSGDFSFSSTFVSGAANYGFSHYLKMTPCQIRKVTVSSTTVYLIVGIPGEFQDYNSSTDVERNLIAVAADGTILKDSSQNEIRVLVEEAIDLDPNNTDNGRKIYLPLDCFEVLSNDGSTATLALGGKDGIHFFDFDLTSGFSEVQNGSTSVYWSPQRCHLQGEATPRLRKAPILSLEVATVGSDKRLFGTTVHGVVFVADVPSSFPTSGLSLLHQEEPLCLAYGLKAFADSFSSLGQSQTDFPNLDVDLTPSLNVIAHFTYWDAFAGAFTFTWPGRGPAGSAYYRVDALTGLIDERRARDVVCRTFNPDRRAAALVGQGPDAGNAWNVFWDKDSLLDLDTHVFQETVDVGQLQSSGQWDLAMIGDQTTANNKGRLLSKLDYLAGSPGIDRQPTSTGKTFMLDDRYYTWSLRAFGNAVRMGNLDNSNGTAILETVLATNGGRLVTYKLGVGSTPWTSWKDDDPSDDPMGDFGWTLAGLATYNIDPATSQDTLDEVFAVGAIYGDASDPDETDSHLMIFESNGSGELSRIFNGDLAEASCTGLWVGPALGKCSCQNQLEVIVGKSQTFAVYSIDRSNKTVNLTTPRYESEGLGWNLGAFNSIEVLREQVDPENSQKRVDYLFIGSDAYVYAYKSPSYTVGGPGGGGGHQH